MNNKLIVISGPTGIGKTETCFKLQSALGCKIISADSRQIYKEISIGTAKPTQEEIQNYNIKVVDHISIFEEYNAGRFEKEALVEIEEDFKNSGYSIMGGGTGLYVQAVCKGLNYFPEVNDQIVESYNQLFESMGIEVLQKELEKKDPAYYKVVDLNNSRRLIRALSVIKESNLPFTHFLNQELPPRNFDAIHIVLNMERETLYNRINARVDKMIGKGLIEEAEWCFQHRHLKSLQTVGYQELFEFFDKNISKEEAIDKIKMNSRRYAKRQMTWLNKYVDGPRFEPNDYDGITKYLNEKHKLPI